MDEKIIANCSGCKGQFRIPTQYAGKSIKCPKCQQPLDVPNVTAPPKITELRKPSAPMRSRSRSNVRKAQPRKDSQIRSRSKSNVRGRISGIRDARHEKDDAKFEKPKKNKMPMIIGISAASLVLVIVIIAVMFGGKQNPEGSSVVDGDGSVKGANNSGNTSEPGEITETAEQIRMKLVSASIEEMDSIYRKASSEKNTKRLFDKLEVWSGMLDRYPKLLEKFTKYMSDYIELQENIVSDIEDRNQQARELLAFARNITKISDRKPKADDLLNRALGISDDYDLKDEIHEELGHVKYSLPENEEWDKILLLNVEKDKLNQLKLSEGHWATESEYRNLKQIEDEIYNEYLGQIGGDPFMIEILKAKQRLLYDPFFKGFEFNIVPAKPFAILLQKEKDDDDWQEAIKDRTNTLLQFWSQINKNWISRLNLKSNLENDSPDNPKPFGFVSFRDKAQYDAYLKKVNVEIPSFARAFYSTNTKFVMFYQDTSEDASSHFEFAVVAHEATHQVHDRYASVELGLRNIDSYWITEGFAELMAGHKTNEKTGEMTFQHINYPDRMETFGWMKEWFGDHDSYVYDNLKNDKDWPFLPPREDWNVCPIECLVTMMDGPFVMYYGEYLGDMYYEGYRKAYNKSNPKDPKLIDRAYLLSQGFQGGPGRFVHSQFYATAWAFTQFMTQRYPDEYDKIFLEVTSGKPVALVFNKVMKLNLELPDISEYMKSSQRFQDHSEDVAKGLFEQIKKIQTCDKVIKLQEEFNTWLRSQYKVVIGKDIAPKANNGNANPRATDDDDDGDAKDDDNDKDDGFEDWIPFSNWKN